MKTKAKNPDKMGLLNLFKWQSSQVSTACNVLILGFFTIYCTDTLLLDPLIVGGLMVVSQVISAVAGLFGGYIVDHTTTKIARGRPLELAQIGLWFCTWLMFSCPESMQMTIKYIWTFAMYIMVTAVFTTLLNSNDVVYMVRAFPSEKVLIKLNSFGSIITSAVAMVFNILFPILMATYSHQAGGWSKLAAIFGIPLLAIGLIRFFTVKEVNNVDVSAQAEGDKLNFKECVAAISHNKYMLRLALVALISSFVSKLGVGVYYFRYIVGSESLLGVVSAVTILALPVMFLVPVLSKKFSIARLTTAGYVMMAVSYLIYFFAGANIPMLMIAIVLAGIGSLPSSYLGPMLQLDCATYNEWQGYERMEGTLGSIKGVASQIGGALGGGAMGVALSLVSYDPNNVSDAALMMIRMMASIVPMVLYIVIVIIMLGYNLDKLMPQINKDVAERRAAVENACGQGKS